jgi:hypothetical protein
MQAQLQADITNDNPAILSTAQKIGAASMVVRKSFLHASWSEMSLASELSGSDALVRVQSRVQDYWDRQWEKRLISSLIGVLYSNVANNGGDMVLDIHALAGTVTLPGTNIALPNSLSRRVSCLSTLPLVFWRSRGCYPEGGRILFHPDRLKEMSLFPGMRGFLAVSLQEISIA